MNSLRTLVRIASPQSLTGWNCRFFKIYKNIFFIKKKKFKNYFFYKIYFFIKLKTLRAMEDVWKFSSALWGSPKNDDCIIESKKDVHNGAIIFWLIAIVRAFWHFHSTGKILELGLAASRNEITVSTGFYSSSRPSHWVKYFLRYKNVSKKFYDSMNNFATP